MLLRWEFCTTKKKPVHKVQKDAQYAEEKKPSQLTIIPNNTPITKSQTVMHTMILIIVIYSLLIRVSHETEMQCDDAPADTMPCIPECLFDEIDTQHEDQSADDHDRCRTASTSIITRK
jgi:hypothetical protein